MLAGADLCWDQLTRCQNSVCTRGNNVFVFVSVTCALLSVDVVLTTNRRSIVFESRDHFIFIFIFIMLISHILTAHFSPYTQIYGQDFIFDI